MASDAGSRPRVSLTKLQRESAAGLELISICQAASEDGVFSDAEISELQAWSARYRDQPFAGHAYLSTIVTRILEDGVVTPTERRDIAAAVEKVLPPDLRQLVAARRRAAEALEAAANAPIDGFDFMVAGCRYEGRELTIAAYARAGDRILLDRDRENDHSRNAIRCILANGREIGFVPESEARELAPHLDAGLRYRAEIKKLLTGGQSTIPVVVVDVYAKGSAATDLVDPTSPLPTARASGCAVVIAVAGLLLTASAVA